MPGTPHSAFVIDSLRSPFGLTSFVCLPSSICASLRFASLGSSFRIPPTHYLPSHANILPALFAPTPRRPDARWRA